MTVDQYLNQRGIKEVVRYNSSGKATFDTVEEAEEFKVLLYQDYHPAGYGTICKIDGTTATWTIWNCD